MWSENSTNRNYQSFPDDDPPFFLRRDSSSCATNVDGEAESSNSNGEFREGTTLAQMDSTVRSIIDDLTIENKLLKARAKTLETRENHSKGVDKDKLFEVNFHNITPSDAKELEDLLSAFVRSRSNQHLDPTLDPTPQLSEANIKTKLAQSPSYSSLNNTKDSINITPVMHSHATQSGASSNKHDSGYASMSMTTEPRSTSNLNNVKPEKRQIHPPKRSHLDDVPRGLQPNEERAISERNRQKMVVQRLEELFTGKKLLLRRNSSISDRCGDRTSSYVQLPYLMEGAREAQIMEQASPKDTLTTSGERPETDSALDETLEPDKTVEQRPTRLRELDPERRQIPADNVNYMRHLGISSPNLQSEESHEAGPDANGWVYLNLLMNLAQLHIMNVTADFVREAVQEVSSKFQVSRDGRRLRWRGGTDPTRMSSVSGSTTTRHSSASSDSAGDKSDETADNGNQHMEVQPRPKPTVAKKPSPNIPTPRFTTNRGVERQGVRHVSHYSPIFSHSSEITGSSDSQEADSPELQVTGQKRVMTANIEQAPQTKKRKISREKHGGIVYYSDAPFFVDLTGSNHHSLRDVYRFMDYSPDFRNILGCESVPAKTESCSDDSLSSQYLSTRKYWDRLKVRDSILTSPDLVTPPELDDYFHCVPNAEDGHSPEAAPLLEFPITMEASCLGCTTPADHFLEIVTSRLEVSRSHISRNQDVPSSLRAESISSFESKSTSQQSSTWKPDCDQEVVWQRIQSRIASLRSTMRTGENTTSRYSVQQTSPEDNDMSSSLLSTSQRELARADANATPEPLMARKIVDVIFRQLEPSPVPPPGLYFSEPSENTEYDTGSGHSGSIVDGPGRHLDSYSSSDQESQDRQYTFTTHRQFGSRGTSLDAARGLNRHDSGESAESSGIGDEEGEDDDSIDMLGFARKLDPNGTSLIERNWEMERERARVLGLDNDSIDEVASLIAVPSPLPSPLPARAIDQSSNSTSSSEEEIL